MPDYDAQIATLRAEIVGGMAETLALQTLFSALMTGLDASGAVPHQVLSDVFETASHHVERAAFKVQGTDSKTSSGEPHTLAALRMIEELRSIFEIHQ